MAVTQCEELHSHRRSQPGSRSRGEHRAAPRNFPSFLPPQSGEAGGESVAAMGEKEAA